MTKKRRLKKSVKILIGSFLGISLITGTVVLYYNNINKPPKPKIQYGAVKDIDANSDYGIIKDPNQNENITAGKKVKYYVLGADEGYSILIDCGKTEVLIDAGGKKAGKAIVKKIDPYVENELDYVISTNTMPNRAGGLPEVLKNYTVKTVIYSQEDKSKESLALKEAAKKSIYEKGNDKLLSLGENASLSIIAPDQKAKTAKEKSLSTVFTYGQIKISETGDLPEKYANHLSDEFEKSSVLVAANNGEYTSNKLLEVIKPTYYVIPTNKKISSKTKKLAEDNVRSIYTTKGNKDIVFTTDGSQIKCNKDKY